MVSTTPSLGAKRVGIRDISKAAGVSVGTVSNVINTPEIVAEHTRERVLAVIEQLGYQRQAAARALTAGRSFMIGYPLFSSGSDASIMGEFFRQLVIRAGDHGLGVTTLVAPSDAEIGELFTRTTVAGAVDGFLLTEVVENDPRVVWLLDHGSAFASFGRSEVPGHDAWVDLDLQSAMAAVADHVLDLGHGRVGYIGWDGQPTNRYRLEGFERRLAERGVRLDPALVATSDFSADGGRRAAAGMLASSSPPTAIVCAHDVLAAGVLRACRDAGLRPGPDLTVTGFDDTAVARATDPALTSVAFPLREVADRAVELLVDRLEGRSPTAPQLLAATLLVRESSQPPPA